MTISKRLIFHVGLPKTGTTAIQHYLLENADALAEAGVTAPADTSQHPRSATGGVLFAPQMAAVSYFFAFSPHFKPAEMDWDGELEALAQARQDATIIVSFEGISYMRRRFRKRVIEALAPDISLESVIYLRQPADFLNSLILQLIMSGEQLREPFGEAFRRVLDRYLTGGYSAQLEFLEGFSTPRVRSYDTAKRNLIRDFCTTTRIPFIESQKGDQVNVKSYGRDTGLVYLGLRSCTDDFTQERFAKLRDFFSHRIAEFDSSGKDFLPGSEYRQVMDLWDRERPELEARFDVSLKAQTGHQPSDDVWRIDEAFGESVLNECLPDLGRSDQDWLKRGVEQAVRGFQNFGEPTGTRPARTEAVAPPTSPDPEVVERTARAIWMAQQRDLDAGLTDEALEAAWDSLADKPYDEARRLLDQLDKLEIEVELASS